MPTEPKSFRQLFMQLKGWVALIPLIIAMGFGAVTLVEGRTAERLDEDGAVATAQITRKEIEERRDGDGNRSYTYWMAFRFVHERQTVEDRDTVSRRFYNRLRIGDETQIRYWRNDPTVNEIEPGSTGRAVLITKLISALALAIALYWVHRCWTRARAAIAVRDNGEARAAEVTGHIDTGVRIGKRKQYRITWRDTEGGTGKSWYLPYEVREDHPVGATITVYADPAGRWPAMWERDVGPARSPGD